MNVGYVRLTLPGGERVLEHRWVWEQAHGPIPQGGLIHHIDRDRTNNELGNLMLVESMRDHARHHRGQSHRFTHGSKLTKDQAEEIKRRWTGQYGQIVALAREFGVSVHHVDRIVHGWNWK